MRLAVSAAHRKSGYGPVCLVGFLCGSGCRHKPRFPERAFEQSTRATASAGRREYKVLRRSRRCCNLAGIAVRHHHNHRLCHACGNGVVENLHGSAQFTPGIFRRRPCRGAGTAPDSARILRRHRIRRECTRSYAGLWPASASGTTPWPHCRGVPRARCTGRSAGCRGMMNMLCERRYVAHYIGICRVEGSHSVDVEPVAVKFRLQRVDFHAPPAIGIARHIDGTSGICPVTDTLPAFGAYTPKVALPSSPVTGGSFLWFCIRGPPVPMRISA